MATFIVTNTNDSGAGSLRQALADAEANGPGMDFVRFDASLAGQTIRLLSGGLSITAGFVEIDGDTDGDGDPDITISGDKTGDGGSSDDVATLVTVGATAIVDLQSVHLTGGYSRGADGVADGDDGQSALAGLLNLGRLYLTNAVISDMYARGGDGHDSAYMPYAPAPGGDGGNAVAGVLNAGTLLFRNTLVTGNMAIGGAGGSGEYAGENGANGGHGGYAVSGIRNSLGTAGIHLSGFDGSATGGTGGHGGDGTFFPGSPGGNGGAAVGGILNSATLIGSAGFAGNVTPGAGGSGGYNGGANGSAGASGQTFLNVGAGTSTYFIDFGSSPMSGNISGFATAGDDVIIGTGQALLFGFQGDDIIQSGAGATDIFGGSGDDIIEGGAGADFLLGGANGSRGDTISYAGSDAAVTVNLTTSAASGGHASGDGFSDIENLTGSNYGDTLTGNNDNNKFVGLAGGDTLNGLSGFHDVADYSDSDAAVTVGINSGGTVTGGHATGDTLIQIEDITGSAFGDALTGTSTQNTLKGNAGDDTLNGAGNNDQLFGDAGDDTLAGGTGADIIDGGSNTAVGDTVSFSNAAARIILTLTNGAGTATGSGQGVGDTITNIENILGSNFNDIFTGDANNNVINGLAGNDTLKGGAGNDELIGGGGLDNLEGGSGNDIIRGGPDADTFVFRSNENFGQDQIIGFQNNADKIDLIGAGFDFADFTKTQSGADTLLTLTADPTQTIRLIGINANTIDATDFV